MHRCVECEESITNPICPDCLAEGVAAWAGEKLGPAVASAVFEMTEAIAYRHGSTTCIKCHVPMQLCAYCYTRSLIDMLREHPAMLTQFLEYFSFDFEKLGYERELAEKYGIVV